jgi:PIN domain nuclease of toxin-antitoxin system
MNLLVDTQALLWFDEANAQLSSFAKSLIEDPANELWLSAASYWKVALKLGTHKLTLKSPFDEFMTRVISENGLKILPIKISHCAELIYLPHHHRDPFDRVMIAQAIVEKIAVVSADAQFDEYPMTRL